MEEMENVHVSARFVLYIHLLKLVKDVVLHILHLSLVVDVVLLNVYVLSLQRSFL